MALSEIVAHIELLEDTGDIEVWEDMRMRSKGSEKYREMIAGMDDAGITGCTRLAGFPCWA